MSARTASSARRASTAAAGSKGEPVLQRKCACGQHTVAGGECAECRKKRPKMQRWSTDRSSLAATLNAREQPQRGVSAPLESRARAVDLAGLPAVGAAPERSPAEPRESSAPSTLDDGAELHEPGIDSPGRGTRAPIAPAPGGGLPSEATPPASGPAAAPGGRATRAAPSAGPSEVEAGVEPRDVEEASATPSPRRHLLIDGTEPATPGQLATREFLARLRSAVTRAAHEELARAGRTTERCPYLRYWFAYFGRRSGRQVEWALRRYAPEAERATRAEDYIPLVAARVRRAVAAWVETGEVTGLPPQLGGVASRAARWLRPGSPGRAGDVAPPARREGVPASGDPAAIQAELGPGQALGAGVRTRMEAAIGRRLPAVRLHTDATAARLASRKDARAFTVGRHVAFGAGEYRPGTPVGDVLLAHELAHAVQQDASASAGTTAAAGASDRALEADADRVAAASAHALWGRARRSPAGIPREPTPRLRSGLRLQRCGGGRAAQRPTTPTASTCPPVLRNPQWDVTARPALLPRNGCSLRLAEASGADGMRFTGEIHISAGCEGRVYFVQNVNPRRTSVACFEGRPMGFCASATWGVDGNWPYAHGSDIPVSTPSGTEMRRINTVDSPGQNNISNPDVQLARLCIRDEFVTYVVFEDRSANLTPLGWMQWRWSGQAWRDGGNCSFSHTSNDCAGWQVAGRGEKVGENFTPGSMNTGMPLDRSRRVVQPTSFDMRDCEPSECAMPASQPASPSAQPAPAAPSP